MTEEAAAPEAESQASKTFALSAATMGRDLTAALLEELRNMPDQWSRLNKDLQQKIIERFKERVTNAIQTAQHMLTASRFTAVPAALTHVNRKGGIKAGLVIAKDAPGRHELFDAEGAKVLVVIVDPAQWLAHMEELKAVGNQADLFDRDTNYDPTIDQGAYRRDTDPLAPAEGATNWDQLKAMLKAGSTPDGSDKAVDSGRVTLHMLHEALLRAGVPISLASLADRTDEERLDAAKWLEYKEHPHLPQPMRPAWLPEPTPPPTSNGDQTK